MDLLELEIHIPVEAEVKNIPVWSLPNSVIKRMGLPPPASEGSKTRTDAPEGIWICPTVIRRKSQNPASHAGNNVKENMSSLLYREFRAAQGPLQMSFVSSNCTAYKLLQDIMPGKKVSSHTSHTSLLPHGSALKTDQDAIVIYHGRIYLIIKNPKRSRSQEVSQEPQPVAQSSLHSTSAVSSDSQEKELLNDNKPNNKDAGRKRPARFQTQGDQEEVANLDSDEDETQDLDRQEAESTDQNNSMDSNMQIDYQNGNHSWTRRDPQSSASACTSPQQSCDFKELERKEKIARLKAKLRENEVDLHNKHSTK
ncbi:uncharacterized protein LOC122982924 isoform X2 [Thunnus albacares]|uniref:uncharacterized protein LOC122982924 isoform X2 n=1 Tax=Thunnus albacares TaxID=8236 RepID=UPI001CF62942|nr:uncharacterized protein LOC122982924 isoform X2 [Thunnus albacares]